MGFSQRFRSRSSASGLADAGIVGWKCGMRPTRMKRPLALLTAFLKFVSACFTVHSHSQFIHSCFSKVFAADFSITCQVRFLEVDVGSPRPINHGQLGVDGDQDGQNNRWPVR